MGRTELDPRAVARVIAAYGFEALRGRRGTGSGAAPSHRLAELPLEGLDTDKRTVARKAARGLPPGAPPASTATPFDFAMAAPVRLVEERWAGELPGGARAHPGSLPPART